MKILDWQTTVVCEFIKKLVALGHEVVRCHQVISNSIPIISFSFHLFYPDIGCLEDKNVIHKLTGIDFRS
jgi:hypothetical protein